MDPTDRDLRELLRVRCLADGEELEELRTRGGGDDGFEEFVWGDDDESEDDTDE